MKINDIINKLNSFPGDWDLYLKEEKEKDYFINLISFVANEYLTKNICPSIDNIYLALEYVNLSDIKLVILGQDPYPGKDVANGLAFGINNNIPIPGSLRNIFKELKKEYNISFEDPSLKSLAKQGVLLLNTCLSVEQGIKLSHQNKGWETFTNNIIIKIEEQRNDVIYLLFGNKAKEISKYINNHDRIIFATHPSPLSANRGFFNSNCFKKANEKLMLYQHKEINYNI